MTTIKEIAKRAGVSAATVSKVLNGKGGASRETVELILALARELNYTPNIYAKNLVSRKSRTLGVITEDLTVFNTPEIVDSIDETCEENDYHYILGNLRINKRFGHNFSYQVAHQKLVDEMISAMLARRVEGIIYVGCNSNETPYLLSGSSIPFVCAYCYSSDISIPSIVYDDQKAAYDAVSLLIRKGHRNIGTICGPSAARPATSRLLGYQEALYDNAIPYSPRTVVYGDWGRDSGYALCPGLLSQGVTAIFSQNDVMATGVLDYCNEKGIPVGSELALIGFDNREISLACRPKLSTVALPLYEIGKQATLLMLDILAGNQTPSVQKLMLPCSIIERQTTCRTAEGEE